MRMRVEEPRRHDQIGGVDDAAGRIFDLSDFRDPAAGYREVRPIARRAGSVDYGSVFYHQVVSHRETPSSRLKVDRI